MKPSGNVVVIGAGNVGSTIAYAISLQEISKNIGIIDINEDLVAAQALDLQNNAEFTNGVKVKATDYSSIEDGDIVIITCGATQKKDQSRLDLLNINKNIIEDVCNKINETTKQVYVIVVTNPVDILTYHASKILKLNSSLVFGSGTYLDTARLRGIISRRLQVNSRNIHAYVIGEHGDSSLPALNSAIVGGVSLNQFMNIDNNVYAELKNQVRQEAYNIISGKLATYYGIGSAVAQICKVIIRDENKIIPLSVCLTGQYGYSEVAISIPVKLNSSGFSFIPDIILNDKEKTLFKNSVEELKSKISY